MLQEGKKAPAFSLPGTSGRTIALKDHLGSVIVLYFYPKDATPGCTREACDFRDALDPFTAAGAVVFGVSADSITAHEKFRAKQGLTFELLSDESHEMLETYGVWKEKSFCGRHFMGIERVTVVIDREGRVAKIWPKVKVDGHADEVLAFVQGM
jgi:thioredoxin-dependent peroxiredoxin